MDNTALLQAMSELFTELDSKFEKRIEEMDHKFEKRIEEMDHKFEKRIDSLDDRFEKHRYYIEENMLAIRKDITNINQQIANMHGEVVAINQNISLINHTINMELRPRLTMLTENYLPAARSFSSAADRIDAMEQDIKGLKSIVAEEVSSYVTGKTE